MENDAIPEPPWRLSAKQRPAPRAPLTREAVIEAALHVMDREGMDGLSMRRVADELGSGPSSLYWHVRNKEELLQLVFERVIEELELPEGDVAPWQEQLRSFADQLRGLMNRHRDFARVSLGRVPSGPVVARLAEWFFALLQPLGVPDEVISYALDFGSLYIGAYAYEESLGVASPTGEELPPEQIAAMYSDYFASLPAARFPRVRAAADRIFGGAPDERFRFGIDLMIRGLQSYARPSSHNEG